MSNLIKAEIIKTHSEIQRLLKDLDLPVFRLTKPPKRYIATLVDESTNATHSLRFHIPHTDGNMPGEPMVIHTLLARLMPELQLTHAALAAYTLDYFIEKHSKNGLSPIKAIGSEIHYTVKKTGPCKRGSERVFLPDTIHLHIAPAIPWVIDDDPYTVETNIREAQTILREQEVLLVAEIKRATIKKEKVAEALAALTVETPQ